MGKLEEREYETCTLCTPPIHQQSTELRKVTVQSCALDKLCFLLQRDNPCVNVSLMFLISNITVKLGSTTSNISIGLKVSYLSQSRGSTTGKIKEYPRPSKLTK